MSKRQDEVSIDDTAVDRDGILGTVFINDKTISLVDLYSILGAQKIGRSAGGDIKIESKGNNAEKHILVVDDSPMYRKMISDLMLELGFKVDSAINGLKAFELVAENPYDLVITDIEMPVLNGYEFAQKVRGELENKTQKILALSTRYSEEDQVKGRNAGFDFHMEKFKKDEIIQKIEHIFNEK